jgi:hypothetical protein
MHRWGGRSRSSRWKTRRGTRTTPRYSPSLDPELHGRPLGIPAGFLGNEGWETVPRALSWS